MDDGALEVHWTGGVPWSGGVSGLVSPGTGWYRDWLIKVGLALALATGTGTGTHVVRAFCNGNGASEGPE
jgi:hypothetical protein